MSSASTLTANVAPTRTSLRLRKQPALYEANDDIDDLPSPTKDGSIQRETPEKRVNTSKFRCQIPLDAFSSPLTDSQKALLNKKLEGDFLGKFEDYLFTVDNISELNRRNVIRQVTKLAEGKGIRQKHKDGLRIVIL